MAQITLKGNPVNTNGDLPKIGEKAADFNLTKIDLQNANLNSFSGKKIVLNIFPSVDTPTCATSVRKFNEEVSKIDNTVVINVSKDLPFAHKRFCGAEGIENAISTSTFRDSDFTKNYKVEITDGPLAGLLARSVIVIDESGNVKYTELVSEIADEPNYSNALESLK